MSKTWHDRPDKYNQKRTKEGRRFESSKGRDHKKSKELINALYNTSSSIIQEDIIEDDNSR